MRTWGLSLHRKRQNIQPFSPGLKVRLREQAHSHGLGGVTRIPGKNTAPVGLSLLRKRPEHSAIFSWTESQSSWASSLPRARGRDSDSRQEHCTCGTELAQEEARTFSHFLQD